MSFCVNRATGRLSTQMYSYCYIWSALQAETEIPLKVARPWATMGVGCCLQDMNPQEFVCGCLWRLLVVSDILHNTTSSRQAAWTCPLRRLMCGEMSYILYFGHIWNDIALNCYVTEVWLACVCQLQTKSSRYRREFEKSLPDIFEQFEIGTWLRFGRHGGWMKVARFLALKNNLWIHHHGIHLTTAMTSLRVKADSPNSPCSKFYAPWMLSDVQFAGLQRSESKLQVSQAKDQAWDISGHLQLYAKAKNLQKHQELCFKCLIILSRTCHCQIVRLLKVWEDVAFCELLNSIEYKCTYSKLSIVGSYFGSLATFSFLQLCSLFRIFICILSRTGVCLPHNIFVV